MAIISQSLSVPSGLATNQTANATDITPLYATMNAFAISDSLFVWVVDTADDTAHSIASGATYSYATSIGPTKACLVVIPFVAAVQHTKLEVYANTTSKFVVETDLTAAASTNAPGMIWMVIGPHDATYTWPVFGRSTCSTDTTSVNLLYGGALPAVTLTDLTLKCTAGGPLTVKGARIWRQA